MSSVENPTTPQINPNKRKRDPEESESEILQDEVLKNPPQPKKLELDSSYTETASAEELPGSKLNSISKRSEDPSEEKLPPSASNSMTNLLAHQSPIAPSPAKNPKISAPGPKIFGSGFSGTFGFGGFSKNSTSSGFGNSSLNKPANSGFGSATAGSTSSGFGSIKKSGGFLDNKKPSLNAFAAHAQNSNNSFGSGFSWLKKKSEASSTTNASNTASNFNKQTSENGSGDHHSDKHENDSQNSSQNSQNSDSAQRSENKNQQDHLPTSSSFDNSKNMKIMGQTENKANMELVEVETGEEHERTIFHFKAKLYEYMVEDKNWAERGVGVLKLNDAKIEGDYFCPYYQDYENTSPTDRKSRLIMRGKGTMRLILNTRLFNDMMVTQANEKSIKLSASNFETGKISMYLIRSNAENCNKLNSLLHKRLADLKFLNQNRSLESSNNTEDSQDNTSGLKRINTSEEINSQLEEQCSVNEELENSKNNTTNESINCSQATDNTNSTTEDEN